jgi:hypothetical protein
MPQYQELFPKGSLVRVKAREVLESFKKEWRYHNPITDAQLAFAGKERRVALIGDYHGGDILYWLEEAPGVWHEQCIESVENLPPREKTA